jgi:SNF2 family DNA or RNA helicase
MQIVNNKGLLIRTHNPQKVVNVIPKSKVIKQMAHPKGPIYELLVFWGYDETRILKNLGYSKTPSPIEGRYKWSGFHRPFDHQRTTAAFLTLHDKCFVFNEAGTGKTSAVIWAADYLMRLGKIQRALVICPLSIMHSAWVSDLFKVAMDRSVQVAYGKADARREVIAGNAEFVIINYDGVEIVQEEIEAAKFDLIICDEATALKNVSTKRWKTINRIVKPNTRLWLLTGTPAAQTPIDAYGLARLVSPARVPHTKGAWQDLTMQKITQYRWSPKPRATEIVYHALQPAIRFTKEECLDLPEVMYMTRDVELTPQQRAYYEKLRTQMLFEAAGEEVTAINAAVKMQKLLQISGGAVYSDDKMVLEFDVSSRLKALEEIVNETSKKILVFVPYRHAIEVVHKYLNKINISNELIHGDVSVSRRTDIFTRFQTQTDPKVLVIQPQAASHGVTLTAADTVVFWSPVMSVETYLQCIARIDRVGQKNKMTVHHIQGSSVERRIYKALMEKKDLHEELTDMYRDIVTNEFTKK